MPNLTPRRRTFLFCLALVVTTLAVYWPVNSAGFLSMDDHEYVSENNVVRAGLSGHGVRWAFMSTRAANYHPVTWLSHMLDCQLFGTDPRWHHRVNLLFHVVTSVLLFFVVRRMTAREGCAAFVAAVFALHPQHVESVAWVSERKDVLSAFFFVLTLWAYTAYVEQGGRLRYALTLALFTLGVLAKPMLVTVPCVLLLLDHWPLKRPVRWGLVVEKVPFFLLSLAASVATVIAQSKGGAVAAIESLPLGFRGGNAIVAYVLYVRKFLYPTDLAAFYPLLKPWALSSVLLALAILVVMTAIVAWQWRKRPYLLVGWLWFLGMMVPVIGLVQVGNQSMADRYMYLPMIGLTVMLAWAFAEFVRWRGVQLAMGVAAVACCVGMTAREVPYWRDSETLFTRALQRTEPNVFALHNLAAAKLLRGDTDAAIANYEQCVRLQPRNPHVRRALGYAFRTAKRYPEAHAQLKRSLQLDPKQPHSWDAMAHLYAEQGKWAEAAEHFEVAVELKDDAFDSWINLAVANRQINNTAKAQAALEQALRINPRLPQPWYMYGRLLVETGQSARAIEPLQRALALNPEHADAYYRLGLALMNTGQGAEATVPLMAALRRNPNSAEIMSRLAWLLATHPDAKLRRGDDAIFLATRAESIQPASAEVLDALAAAQAEQRRYDEAVKTATRAAELARAAGDMSLAQKIESRVAKYRSRTAARDASLAETGFQDAVP